MVLQTSRKLTLNFEAPIRHTLQPAPSCTVTWRTPAQRVYFVSAITVLSQGCLASRRRYRPLSATRHQRQHGRGAAFFGEALEDSAHRKAVARVSSYGVCASLFPVAWFLWLVPFGFGSFDLFASDPSPWLGPFALAPFAHSTQGEGSRVEGERESRGKGGERGKGA